MWQWIALALTMATTLASCLVIYAMEEVCKRIGR